MERMTLNEVVTDIIAGVVAGKSINKRDAAIARWDDIDPDGQYIAGIDGVVLRIDHRARALRVRTEKSNDNAQIKLPFELPAAVAMDIEGTTMLSTRELSRKQFVRAIAIRKGQIANDRAALREWQSALKQADQFWSENPDWTFGTCLDAIMAGPNSVLVGGAA